MSTVPAERAGQAEADLTAAGIWRGRRGRRVRRRIRSPVTASFLSFVWPGLGQWYARQPRRALVYALPPAIVGLGLVAVALQGMDVFVVRLLVPSFALGLIGLIGLHAIWRTASIIDAWRRTRRDPLVRDRSLPVVVLLSLAVLLSHAFAGYYIHSFSSAGAAIFQDDASTGGVVSPLDDILGTGGGNLPPIVPVASPLPTPAGGSPASAPTPSGVPAASPPPPSVIGLDSPVTVLFVGVDSGPGRDHALTDTLLVASFDPQRNQVSMISIPRDTGFIPMFDGGVYVDRINSLLGFAKRNPDRFPQGPIMTLVQEMQYLIGIPIDYYAVTDMAGLEQLINLVDGVDVVIEQPISDPHWGFVMEPGIHHLDGATAMIVVRSRYGAGNSDFVRARRQQQVIKALAKRAQDPSVIARLPDLFRTASQITRSNIPVEQLPALLDVLRRMAGAETRSFVLAPNRYAQRVPPEQVGGRYMIELRMDAVAQLSVELFGSRSRYAR